MVNWMKVTQTVVGIGIGAVGIAFVPAAIVEPTPVGELVVGACLLTSKELIERGLR